MKGEEAASGATSGASKATYQPSSLNRASPFSPVTTTSTSKPTMPATVFVPQNTAFRPAPTAQPGFPGSIKPMHIFDRDASKIVGSHFGSGPPGLSSILIRRLPLNTSEESLRLMFVWSKELVSVEVLPAEQSEDVGFRSAILKFRTAKTAQEAKSMFDGKSNISNDANMIVEILSPSIAPSRRYAHDASLSANASSTASSAASSAPNSRQPSRFNGMTGGFHSLDRVSPPMGSVFGVNELPNPDSSTPFQNLFSPQSPIGNHLTDRARISGKTLIKNDAADDDETGELLKDPVAYAENGAATAQRRGPALPATQQLPIGRMSGLSLNTSTSGLSTLPAYNSHSIGGMSAHSGAMSPAVLNGGNHGMNYPMGGGHFRSHNLPPVNPADQNPPCNTLYVGNLPIDTSEEELKQMFSKQRGYKRLCFRTKQNGPMCFVEFEDISFATKALHELYGQPLHNSIKGGIRLSFSKNPLGVRSGQTPVHSAGMAGMNMQPGVANGFTTASGPPPGLAAPPGLSSGRMGYGGNTPNGVSNHQYNFPTSSSNIWSGTMYNNSTMASGPPNSNTTMNGTAPSYLPPHMMGR